MKGNNCCPDTFGKKLASEPVVSHFSNGGMHPGMVPAKAPESFLSGAAAPASKYPTDILTKK